MSKTLQESIAQLLSHASRNSNSGRACRLALLASCYPAHYPLDVSDLLYLDEANKTAALDVLRYRIVELESIEKLIGGTQFQRLHDEWWRDHPDNDETDIDYSA